MKTFNSFLCLTFIMGNLLLMTSATVPKVKDEKSVSTKIEAYLSTVTLDLQTESVIVYSDFLIKENNNIYTVDFLVTAKGEVVVLNKNHEDEYYKMDTYSTKKLKQHSVAVATVKAIIHKA